ncbi:hypothetical protein [Pseudonocardia alni]|uniref:hypothetical protein n=1 Tax=Pseudonocardia alni TaxID=33907 RepID=UPI00332E2CCE
MILPVAVARGVAAGGVDRVYRRWARSRVAVGSTLRTAAGVVEVVAVDEVDPDRITDDDARAGGPGPGRRCGWSPSCPGSGPPSSRSGPGATPRRSSATSARSRSWA